MSEVTRRLATDSTLQATNTALGTMDTDLKAVAKDSTLQATNTALGTLHTDLQGTGDALDELDADLKGVAKDTTLQTVAKDATLQAIASILASVKSVNGKYGVIVLDSGDILITKDNTGGKTVKQVLTELQTAVGNTPLSFEVTAIPDSSDNVLVVTQGTPS